MPNFPVLFPNSAFPVNMVAIGSIILTGLIVLVIMRVALAKMDMRRPRGMQNFVEWAIDFAKGMARDTMPTETAVNFVLPLAFFTLFFLFIANWLGLIMTIGVKLHQPIPWLGLTAAKLAATKGEVLFFDSPTANMSVALGLAVLVWLISHARGLRHPKLWFRHFFSPSPLGLLEEITNPLTHGMRLFGNIFAGEALLTVMLNAPFAMGWIPWTVPLILVWLLYAGFVASVQAYVFSVLLCLYIGNKSFEGHAHHA
ncbi:F0F1 ATP synthase subunit A [Alicyclobacillus curvatus]|nr:F0F1 ATP synthase subunit A [Alicyclobacillus curvatus]